MDAVRRGASRELLPDHAPPRRRRRDDHVYQEGEEAAADEAPDTGTATEAVETEVQLKRRKVQPVRRMRPGAANAAAPRQAYSIVPSAGKRTTFD